MLAYAHPSFAQMVGGATVNAVLRGRTPRVEHKVRQIAIAHGVTLEVLDWGGTGPVICLLAGLGNTAHVFDDFAPELTSTHRVIGVTRRGFGLSARPRHGYSLDTLARDVRTVLDSLGIAQVALVVHSFGGDEATQIAAAAPDRVRAIVYLDAAYDRSDPDLVALSAESPMPLTNGDTSAASRAAAAAAALGAPLPLHELTPPSLPPTLGDGVWPESVSTPLVVLQQIVTGIRRPAFGRVSAPACAVYAAFDSVANVFPFYRSLPADGQAQARRAFEIARRWQRTSILRFSAAPRGHVLRMPGVSHFVFLRKPRSVAALVRRFLASVGEAHTSRAPTISRVCDGLTAQDARRSDLSAWQSRTYAAVDR